MISFSDKNGFIPIGFAVVLFITIITAVLVTSRLPSKPLTVATQAGACGCDPPPDTHGWTDNFCFWPPNTSGCSMTNAGGYCDPNGDKSYQDADWNRGFNEYHSQCGSTATNTPKPTSGATNTPNPTSSTATSTPKPTNGSNANNPTSTTTPAGNNAINNASCGCSPPADSHGWTDNFCFWPPNTSGCSMTTPKTGYCDPNGDGSYQDADWNRGFYEYHAQCGGSITPTSGTNNPTPTITPTPTQRPLSCCTSDPQCGVNFECKERDSTCNSGLRCKPAAGITASPTPTTITTMTTLTPTPTKVATPTPTTARALCEIYAQKGDPSKKYDLIIIPSGYADFNKFKTDASVAINFMFSTNIDSSVKNKINVILYTKLDVDYAVNTDGIGDLEKAANSMSDCHGDGLAIIVNVDPNDQRRAGVSYGLGGNRVYVINTDYGLHALVHELGHGIASLGDEYSYGVTSDKNRTNDIPLNCDTKFSGSENTACAKWAAKYPHLGCYTKCSFDDWYRPTFISIMETIRNDDYTYRIDFNDISRQAWANALSSYQ